MLGEYNNEKFKDVDFVYLNWGFLVWVLDYFGDVCFVEVEDDVC